MYFKALYTKDLVRKAKRWQDGFVIAYSPRNMKLVSEEDESCLGTASVPSAHGIWPLDSDVQDVRWWDGYIVSIDEACDASQVPVAFRQHGATGQSEQCAQHTSKSPGQVAKPSHHVPVFGPRPNHQHKTAGSIVLPNTLQKNTPVHQGQGQGPSMLNKGIAPRLCVSAGISKKVKSNFQCPKPSLPAQQQQPQQQTHGGLHMRRGGVSNGVSGPPAWDLTPRPDQASPQVPNSPIVRGAWGQLHAPSTPLPNQPLAWKAPQAGLQPSAPAWAQGAPVPAKPPDAASKYDWSDMMPDDPDPTGSDEDDGATCDQNLLAVAKMPPDMLPKASTPRLSSGVFVAPSAASTAQPNILSAPAEKKRWANPPASSWSAPASATQCTQPQSSILPVPRDSSALPSLPAMPASSAIPGPQAVATGLTNASARPGLILSLKPIGRISSMPTITTPKLSGLAGLRLPDPLSPQSEAVRQVVIPTQPGDVSAYLQVLVDATVEEANLLVGGDFLTSFREAVAKHQEQGKGADFEQWCWSRRIPYFRAQLEESYLYKKDIEAKRKAEEGDSGAGSDIKGSSQPQYFLKGVRFREVKTFKLQARKGDVWFVSMGDQYMSGGDLRPGMDRMRAPSQATLKSVYHGFSPQDGKCGMMLLAGNPRKQRIQEVFALRGPEVHTEIQVSELLQSFVSSPSIRLVPILQHLANTPSTPCPLEGQSMISAAITKLDALPKAPANKRHKGVGKNKRKDDGSGPTDQREASIEGAGSKCRALVEQCIERFRLNEDQASVLRHVASWLSVGFEDGIPQLPVCLVHGPFGSGKSTLLAAIIIFLVEAREKLLPPELSSGLRILVAAHTNVAVDRVLCSLIEKGFTDLLRVGSLKRMDTQVLPYSLHSAGETKESEEELKGMLRSAVGDEQATAVIKRELEVLKQGGLRQRKSRLKSSPVVGTTCCALMQPQLWGDAGAFPVVILDEATQMTEPLSVVPLLIAKASFVVAAGDPQQLPPVLAEPPRLTAAATAATAAATPATEETPHGLSRPLFVRLRTLGYPCHLLRTQYRCHPALAHAPNQVFYAGQLRDGVTAEERAPLPGVPLPAQTMVPMSSSYGTDGRSSYNLQEAQVVAQVVKAMLDKGVDPSGIGVVCFFKAQVYKIQQLLSAMVGAPPPTPCTGVAAADDDGSSEGDAPARGVSAKAVQVASVDSFQGAEKQVVLLATTKASQHVADAARLNVALTRAKCHLLVFGSPQGLAQASPAFKLLVDMCSQCRSVAPEGQPPPHAMLLPSQVLGLLGAAPQPPAPARTSAPPPTYPSAPAHTSAPPPTNPSAPAHTSAPPPTNPSAPAHTSAPPPTNPSAPASGPTPAQGPGYVQPTPLYPPSVSQQGQGQGQGQGSWQGPSSGSGCHAPWVQGQQDQQGFTNNHWQQQNQGSWQQQQPWAGQQQQQQPGMQSWGGQQPQNPPKLQQWGGCQPPPPPPPQQQQQQQQPQQWGGVQQWGGQAPSGQVAHQGSWQHPQQQQQQQQYPPQYQQQQQQQQVQHVQQMQQRPWDQDPAREGLQQPITGTPVWHNNQGLHDPVGAPPPPHPLTSTPAPTAASSLFPCSSAPEAASPATAPPPKHLHPQQQQQQQQATVAATPLLAGSSKAHTPVPQPPAQPSLLVEAMQHNEPGSPDAYHVTQEDSQPGQWPSWGLGGLGRGGLGRGLGLGGGLGAVGVRLGGLGTTLGAGAISNGGLWGAGFGKGMCGGGDGGDKAAPVLMQSPEGKEEVIGGGCGRGQVDCTHEGGGMSALHQVAAPGFRAARGLGGIKENEQDEEGEEEDEDEAAIRPAIVFSGLKNNKFADFVCRS